MKIKAGYGYWETTRYPIGGEFHRTGSEGLALLAKVRDLDPPVKGCDAVYSVDGGRTLACNSDYIEH